jgi:phage shock protein A
MSERKPALKILVGYDDNIRNRDSLESEANAAFNEGNRGLAAAFAQAAALYAIAVALTPTDKDDP